MNRNIITIVIIGALTVLWASKDIQIGRTNSVVSKTKPIIDNLNSSSDLFSIPFMLNYQGKLTDVSGNPVRDSTYSITFRFFRVPASGSALWNETQNVQTTNGLFNVLLGSSRPIDSMPQDGNCYLEMQVNPNSPMTSRIRLVSSPYSYLSRKADSANYLTSGSHNHLGESWTSTTLDRGLKIKLNIDTSVSVYCHIDTALNAGSGLAAGALIYAGGVGTGPHYGALSYGYCPTGSDGPAVGIYGRGTNQGNGDAYGGSFNAQGAGSGTRLGVNAYSTGDYKVWGVRGEAVPTSASADTGAGILGLCNVSGSGPAFGGLFSASGTGGGSKYGVYSRVSAGSNVGSQCTGISGFINHAGAGQAYGGYFRSGGDGTGNKCGVIGMADAQVNSGNPAIGVEGYATHYGTGNAYGVLSYASGSYDTAFGVYGTGSSAGSAPAFGVFGKSDEGRGGYFRNANNNYYALTAWNSTGTGSTVRGLYVQGHGYATGGWQTFLDDGGTGFSLVAHDMEIVTSGSGSLINGKSDIAFDPKFSRAISEAIVLKVIITPTSDCNGVFVSNKSSSGFSVSELISGKSNATFDWIAIGRLRNFDQRNDSDPIQSGYGR